MGVSKSTPLSKRKQKELWRDHEYYMQLAVQRVENAILLSYMIGSKLDSVLLTLRCSEGRRRFNDYVIFEKKSADVDFWYDCRRMSDSKMSNFWNMAERIYDLYLAPSSTRGISLSQEMRDCVADVLKNCLLKVKGSSNPSEVTMPSVMLRKNVLVALAEAEEETLGVVSTTYWSQFLQSRSYIFWRCHERSHAAAITAADITYRSNNKLSGTMDDCGTGESSSVITDALSLSGNGASESFGSNSAQRIMRGVRPLSDLPRSSETCRSLTPTYKSLQSQASLCQRALSAVAPPELSSLLSSGSQWLVVLLAAVEGVPLCFSLHSATRDASGQPSLPFVFANKYYERIFGVDRLDLHGKPLSCLFRTQYPTLIPVPALNHPSMDSESSGGSSSTSGIPGKQGTSLLMTNFHQILKDLSAGKSCVFSRKMARDFVPQGAQATQISNGACNAENSRSVGIREANGLIVGLKPVYCDDDKSIKYFIALQHQVTSEDNWVHAFKYIGDVLALMPDAFDLQDSEAGYEAACTNLQEFVPMAVRNAENASKMDSGTQDVS